MCIYLCISKYIYIYIFIYFTHRLLQLLFTAVYCSYAVTIHVSIKVFTVKPDITTSLASQISNNCNTAYDSVSVTATFPESETTRS